MVSDKVVLHFDMDSFYCQVDSRRLGVPPTAPLVVDQWGMLLSVNYPAKALGISRKTPAAEAASMGAIVAHVCVVDIETGEKFDDINSAYRDRSMYKASLDRYREASEEVMTVMKEALTVPASFERASIDECYVDISGDDLLEIFPEIPDVSKLCWEGGGCYDMSSASDAMLARGALLGERIRSEVFAVTSFTVSCGVSLTRQVAKLACALNKPNKLTVVARSRTTEFMRSVPIKEIRGLGPRGMETLKQRVQWVSGSTPAGDLWEVDLGSDDFGKWLLDAVRGLNDDPVKETALVAGSVQSSKQFRPSLKPELVKGMLKSLCSDMLERLGDDRIAKTLVVTLQSGETVRSRQEKFPGENQQVFEMVDALCDKTGLLNGLCKGFDRLAVTAKDVSDSRAKKQVAEYLSSSRLHFMGTWRTRYLEYVASGNWGEGEVSASTNNVFEKYKSQTGPEMHLLVDMDCFFCSVAMLLRGMDPEAAPVAVASGLGATSEICSANYSARKFGVKAGSFVASARERCPELVLLAIDGATLSMCEKIWKKVIRILALAARNDLSKVTGRSCDEALLDLAGIVCPDSYTALMQDVQETVMKECAVPCSVGIAPTRLLAKIATSLAKPRGAKLINSVSEGADLLCGQQVSALPGVGFSTQQKLRSFLRVETVGDLLKHSSELPRLLGAGIARKLVASAKGLDPPDEEEEKEMMSSVVSAEKNFGLRNLSLREASDLLAALCDSVESRRPPNTEVERATLKLKLAGEDWVEPEKKGGIGNAQDYSRSVPLVGTIGVHAALSPLLAEVDPTKIRGIGVALKLESRRKRKDTNALTLEEIFAGKRTSRGQDKDELQMREEVQSTRATAFVTTDCCKICGSEVIVGKLTEHLLTHLNQDEIICPCPICGDLVELTDSAHVAAHFELDRPHK